MGQVITYARQNLTKNFALLALLLLALSCHGEEGDKSRYTLRLPSGEEIRLELAMTPQEHTKGLSGRPADALAKDEGMLFVYENPDIRQFWMPDTHFDLTIAFLDKNFRITALERDVPKHPSKEEPIPRTGTYWSYYVLEIRNDSPLAEKLKKDMKLKWTASSRPWEKESKTHRQQ